MREIILVLMMILALGMSGQVWSPIDSETDSLVSLLEHTRDKKSMDPRSREWVRQLYEKSRTSKSVPLKWRAVYWDGYVESRFDNNEVALARLDQALKMVDTVKYNYDYHRINWTKTVVSEPTNLLLRYHYGNAELKYYIKVNDKMMQAQIYNNIAMVMWRKDVPEKAKEYYRKAQSLFRETGFEGSADLLEFELLVLDKQTGRENGLKARYDKMIELFKERTDTMAWIIGLVYGTGFGLDDSALEQAYKLARKVNFKEMMVLTTYNMGVYYLMERNEPRRALGYYKMFEDSSYIDEYSDHYYRLGIIGGISRCYEALGRYDSAYMYTRQYYDMRDSLEALNSNAEFQKLLDKTSLEREEEKLQQERERSRARLFVLSLVFVVVVLVVFVFYLQSQRRLKESENRQLAITMENEQLQRNLYQQQCEQKKRELTANSLLLMEKHKLMDSLNREIDACCEEGRIDPYALASLQNIIKLHRNTEDSLSQFYDYFKEIHPDFFKILKSRFPHLTQDNLRLCAYIRIGLDGKQLAQILSVQLDAVKKARYRLRKKLGLNPEDSLEDFLAGISES